MQIYDLKDFVNGWFIGFFEPSIHKTENFEICLKHFKSNDREEAHFQKISTEISIVVSGVVQFNDEVFYPNAIISILPGEIANFVCLEDAIVVGIKFPSVPEDKVLA
jgi:hypothetical protein